LLTARLLTPHNRGLEEGGTMLKAVQGWIGSQVKLTLRATVPVTLDGTLVAIDEAGALLEQVKGRVFIPMSSILHVCIVESKKRK
jgi:hypothetical protein